MLYNEEELIQNAQKGDSEAFGGLYDRHIKVIYDFIYYRTRHKETAEDLTSQTFFKALRSIQSVDSSKPFISWLYKIAHNTVVDHYRTRKITEDIDEIFTISDDTDFVSSLDSAQEASKVQSYLDSLSPVERSVIIMRVWQEMSYKEIAEVLDKTEASCKMIYSRSIKKLREKLV